VLSLMRTRTLPAACVLAVATLGGSPAARAQGAPATTQDTGPSPGVKACLDATEDGQKLRDGGAYLRARERFIACAAEKCPGEVRKSCVGWLEDLDKLVPTVVFAASARGADVTDVRVTIDGSAVVERLDGTPVSLDPGEHRFHFERAGEASVDQTVVLRAGEKERAIGVRFGPEPAPTLAAPPSAAAAAPVHPAGGGGAFYALSAFGLASVLAGAVLDVSGYVFLQQCGGDSTCSGGHERAEVQWRFVAGDLLLAAGVASGVGAWLLRPRDTTSAAGAPRPVVGVDPGARTAKLGVVVAF
jgi:hypothetical protein